MNPDINNNPQIIKPAKCCYNCLYFNNSIDSLKGYCTLMTEDNNIIDVYPYEYCNLFKLIKKK